MIELYTSPWRKNFEGFLKGVKGDLLIASPFIKTREADWICKTLKGRSVRLQVLTNVRSDSVLSGSLDMEALRLFSSATKVSANLLLPPAHPFLMIEEVTKIG